MHEVEFVSQRCREYAEIGCGVACTMMLLKYHFPTNLHPTYKRLAHELKIDVAAKKKGKEYDGAYPEDITNYFDVKDISYNSTTTRKLTTIKNRLVNSPIMVGMEEKELYGEAGHWVVLIGYKSGEFIYLDPYKKQTETYTINIKEETFLQQWDGASIQIVPKSSSSMKSVDISMPEKTKNYSGRWPFRQEDPEWKNDLMWDYDKVIKTHMCGNGASSKAAKELIYDYGDGNTIGNEGCQLTSLAMVLYLLDLPKHRREWTPAKLNEFAHNNNYYTPAGLSMVPLYADIVSEVTNGEVQMCAKEEYHSGEKGWPPNFVSTSYLVKAYRLLSPNDRSHFAVMLKTGTYDDTFASHYLLLDPDAPGDPDEDDACVLDPAMPLEKQRPWRLSESAKSIQDDYPEIKAEWKKKHINPMQICGVWLFANWQSDRMLLEPIVAVLASEFNSKR